MKTLWRVYRVLLVANFQQASQYRVQSVLWLLFAVVRPVVFLAAWSAAAAAQGGSIGDYSIADFAAYYVCLTLVTQLTMAWNAYDFELEVRQGKLAPKLLRPLLQTSYLEAPILNILVPQVLQVPFVAGLPFFIVIAWGFFISLFDLHFTQ